MIVRNKSFSYTSVVLSCREVSRRISTGWLSEVMAEQTAHMVKIHYHKGQVLTPHSCLLMLRKPRILSVATSFADG
jgi:hypothetical protein